MFAHQQKDRTEHFLSYVSTQASYSIIENQMALGECKPAPTLQPRRKQMSDLDRHQNLTGLLLIPDG